VTDHQGHALAGVEVSAHCGAGTLHRTGVATSGEDGRYELYFGPGILFGGKGPHVQAATIGAHKPGYFEENLCRQGGCVAAEAMPDEQQMKLWGVSKDRLFLPDHPIELNFVMRLAARVAGKLVDEQGQPLAGYGVGLSGADTPPSSGAVRGCVADAQGRFAMEDIPTTFRYQFVVRKSDPKPPWDDSWASAALKFDQPGEDDLRAWFGDREIRLREFVLRVAGPGMHNQTATPIAGNVGVLSLTASDPVDVFERSDTRLVAKSAVLTLRNTSRPDLTGSLIADSVPAAPAIKSPTRLARTQPNEAGEFTISFENPSGMNVKAGRDQVVFQVFVGVSYKPIHERIFKRFDIQDGRYEVPVKIAPEWLDDSRVSITFLTIQPNHDAWIKAFFDEGKGTSYKGLWSGDGNLLPAIPFEPEGLHDSTR
jgi:hypothetical protein